MRRVLRYHTAGGAAQVCRIKSLVQRRSVRLRLNQFGVQDTAIVSVEKEADKTSVNVGDTFTYTISITNHADAGADLVDPIVIDFLPQGVGLAGTDTDVRLTDARTNGF